MSFSASELRAARTVIRATEREARAGRVQIMQPGEARTYLKARFMGQDYETFDVIYLDSQHQIVGAEKLFRGTIDASLVYPREVVKQALHYQANAVLFAHNHPSGIAEPSSMDRTLTDRLKAALALVDIRVLDHFVVGSNVVSFAERGWI